MPVKRKIVGDPNYDLSDTGVQIRRYSDDRGPARLKHHAVLTRTETTEGGETRHPVKTESLLDRLKRNGAIKQPQYDAGEKFQNTFQRAGLHRVASSSLVYVDGCGQASDLQERTLADRESVYRTIGVLGGNISPSASVVWYCLGCGETLNDWVGRQATMGRTTNVQVGRGLLVGALYALASHWGLTAD